MTFATTGLPREQCHIGCGHFCRPGRAALSPAATKLERLMSEREANRRGDGSLPRPEDSLPGA